MEEQIKELMEKYGDQYREEIVATLKELGLELKNDISASVMTEVEGKLNSFIATKEAIVDDKVKKNEHGFKGLWDFASAVRSKDEASMGKLKGLETSVQGEFVIPEGYANEIFKVALDNANFVSQTRQFQVAGNTLNIPYRVDKNHTSGNVLGGLTLYWTEAQGSITATDLKFGKVALRLNKLAGLMPVDNEFMEDAPMGVDTLIRDVFGEAAGFELDRVLLKGNGAGQPLGVKNGAALVSAAKETNQTAATVVSGNIFKMYAKLWNRSRSNAQWIYSPDVLPQLLSMTVGDFPVFLPGNNVFGRPTDTILGMPAIENEHCETVGTTGDIYLVDWSQYITISKGANFAESAHLYFDTDRMAFRITLRIDGQPWWETYLTLENSVTKSPFVKLDVRS